jgi:hypothetical protein
MPFFAEGRYRASIYMAQLTQAKSGTPQVEITLDLISDLGDDGQEYAPPASRFPPRLFLALTESTIGTSENPGWVAETLKHIGFDGDFDNLDKLMGWTGVVRCRHEEDQNGKMQDRWEIDRGPQKPKVIPKDPGQVRKLNTLFGRVFKGSELQTVTSQDVGTVPAEILQNPQGEAQATETPAEPAKPASKRSRPANGKKKPADGPKEPALPVPVAHDTGNEEEIPF